MARRPRIAVLVLALLLASPAALGADAFVAGIEDLPVMAGLEAVPAAGLVFDKPGGRIVEAYAAGKLTSADVATFYANTLPQLGWEHLPGLSFSREGERLDLSIREEAEGVVVLFALSPE